MKNHLISFKIGHLIIIFEKTLSPERISIRNELKLYHCHSLDAMRGGIETCGKAFDVRHRTITHKSYKQKADVGK